ncbi:MAG: hypothetical protein M1484_03375 [Patescibacteria group bacterium]|nr:hypothetical protein [Patescibacteria group bacterium]MCL5432103.1 hypothetical protein [Patescibacteria group bacterium]
MNIKYKIQSCERIISFQTHDNDVINYLSNDPLPLNHIPCYKISLGKSASDFSFVHKFGDKSSLVCNLQKSEVVLTAANKIPGGQFVFAFLPIFERLYESRGLYGLHAGLVILNGCAVFLIGDTKAGKSIISAKLHYDFGADFVTDERSIISTADSQIFAGSKILSLRESAIKAADIKDIEKYRLSDSNSTSKNYYKPKSNLSLPIKIEGALFIFPHFGNTELTTEIPSDFVLTYMLYENITATIRSCISIFVPESVGMPSMDNDALSTRRAHDINKLLSRIPHKCFDITGSLDAICSKIYKEANLQNFS